MSIAYFLKPRYNLNKINYYKDDVMAVGVFFSGLAAGFILKIIIDKVSHDLANSGNLRYPHIGYSAALLCGILFIISYLKLGINIKLIEALALDCMLILVSYIDFQFRIIPDKFAIITLIIGVVFSFICRMNFVSTISGMLLGGGLLLLLALIPNAMGGGDVKLMFAFGSFLGPYRVLLSLSFAFIISACISIFLLIFKIIGRKDHIPFGPFLAAGSFIAFHFFI